MTHATTPAVPLRQRILKAGSWSLAGHALTQILRLGSTLIMTRLLMPELFGVMSLVFSIMVTVALLADIGLRPAIVQSAHGDKQELLDTAFTMQVIRGFLVYAVCLAVAAMVWAMNAHGLIPKESVYATPGLPLVIAVTTFTVIVAGFDSVKLYVADRRLELKRVSLIEVYSLVASTGSMILMSLWSKTIWPLVFGQYFGAILTLILSHVWLHGPRDRFRWNPVYARELWQVGRWILLSSALSVLAMNGDRLMLGAWSTQAQMGYYHIALTLVFAMDSAAARLVGNVATPAFSEVFRQDPSRLRQAFWRLRMPMDAALVAASALLFALSPVIIDILYDDRYIQAGHVLSILSLGLLTTRFAVSGSVYVAAGKAKYLTAINAARLVALMVMLPLGYQIWGLDGAYWAVALHTLMLVPLYWFFNRRFDLLDWGRELKLLAVWPLAYALGMGMAWVMHRLFGLG